MLHILNVASYYIRGTLHSLPTQMQQILRLRPVNGLYLISSK